MHWAIVLLVVMLLFGSRRLPDTARGLARSLRIFKSEMGDADQPAHAQPQAQPAAPATQGDLSNWPKPEQPAAIPAPAAISTAASAPASAPAATMAAEPVPAQVSPAHPAPQPTMIAPRPELSGDVTTG